MGLFNKSSSSSGNLFSEPITPPTSRNTEFHGTLADIKATPKVDMSKPDPRLEALNRRGYF